LGFSIEKLSGWQSPFLKMESHPCGEELGELVVESTVFLLADVDGIGASIERESRGYVKAV
jgi:hypothetical protein